MRATVVLDDELVATAQSYMVLSEKSALLREALKSLIEREAGYRLARLGDVTQMWLIFHFAGQHASINRYIDLDRPSA